MPVLEGDTDRNFEKKSMDELERLSILDFKNQLKNPFSLILDGVRSLQNVGSIFRTADSFNLEKLYLCGITGTPPNKEINKTALGATESVNWEYQSDIVKVLTVLKKAGYQLFALEQTKNSVSLEHVNFSTEMPIAIVLGNEVFGVSKEALELIDGCIEIPQFGTKHSLNVAVSTGILVWDYYSKSIGKTLVKPLKSSLI